MSVKKVLSRFEHFLSSQKMKVACKRYFSSISTETDSSSPFFTTSALKCTSEVNKAHYNELREENYFFSLLSKRSR